MKPAIKSANNSITHRNWYFWGEFGTLLAINLLFYSQLKMKKILLYLSFCVITGSVFAQNKNVQTARTFLDHLAKEEFADAHSYFDPSVNTQLTEEQLGVIWKKLNAQVGKYQRVMGIRTEAKKEFELVFLSCSFENALLDMQLNFNPQGNIIGIYFIPPSSKEETETVETEHFKEDKFTIESGDYKLPAVMTYPKHGDKFPVVILVHGSGPNDKDGTIGPNKPLRDLAHGLAQKGIASFRYDKRNKSLRSTYDAICQTAYCKRRSYR